MFSRWVGSVSGGVEEAEGKIWEARLRRRDWAPDIVVVMRMKEARIEVWADQVQDIALLPLGIPAS